VKKKIRFSKNIILKILWENNSTNP